MKRSLAIVCLSALVAFAASAANITHRGTAKFFAYSENGPIGSNWATNIPPEYIPGGTSPSNACTRLTADTRLAFVGAFDAYFRRLMASVCFGTAECTNYTTGADHSLIIDETADWYEDDTIAAIFDETNGWYAAANRDYAVTNITVIVSNWVGWVTNVVTLPSGKKTVKIENRYTVETRQIPDTTRILARYRDGQSYLRGKSNDNGTAKMIDWRSVSADIGLHYDYYWPNRDTIRPPQVHQHYGNLEWTPQSFIGWSSSAASAPDGSDVDLFGWSSEWVPNLCDAVEHWAYFYPTTWDIFDAPAARTAVWDGVFMLPNPEPFLYYDSNCPEEWEQLEQLVKTAPYGGRAQYATNAFDVVFDVVTATNLEATSGFQMLTNLVELYIAGTNNAPLRAHMLPTETNTYHRIDYAEWAGTDGFLALADMAIAGPQFMPILAYDSYLTNATIDVKYSSPTNGDWFVSIYGDYDTGYWEMTNREVVVGHASTTATPGDGKHDWNICRAEGVNVGESYVYFSGTGAPGAILEAPTATTPGIGINRTAEARDKFRDEIIGSLAWDGGLWPGKIINIGWGFVEHWEMGEPHIVAAWSADGDWFYYYPNAWVSCVLTGAEVDGFAEIASVSTKIQPRPFGYKFDRYMSTNSVPCSYPNPTYAGRRGDSGKVEFVDEIKPTAISTIASTTNTEWMSAADAPVYGGNYESNGYRFALAKPSAALYDAKDVDQFWKDTDAELRAKMIDFVTEANGIRPSRDPAALAADAKPNFDLDLLPQSAGGNGNLTRWLEDGLQSGAVYPEFSTYCDPADIRITRCDYDPDWDPSEPGSTPWIIEYETVRMDTNGNWQVTGEDVWRCMTVQISATISTNTTLKSGGRYAAGRMTGVEAVRWDFDTMKRAKELQ